MGELEFNRRWHHAQKVRAGQSPRFTENDRLWQSGFAQTYMEQRQ